MWPFGDEEEDKDSFEDDYRKVEKCPVCGVLIDQNRMMYHMFARTDVEHAVYAVHQS